MAIFLGLIDAGLDKLVTKLLGGEHGRRPETPESFPEDQTEEIQHIPDNAKWYVIHTYSGYEKKVKKNLRTPH